MLSCLAFSRNGAFMRRTQREVTEGTQLLSRDARREGRIDDYRSSKGSKRPREPRRHYAGGREGADGGRTQGSGGDGRGRSVGVARRGVSGGGSRDYRRRAECVGPRRYGGEGEGAGGEGISALSRRAGAVYLSAPRAD